MIASVNLPTIAAGSDAKEPWQIEAERQRREGVTISCSEVSDCED